MSLGAAKRRQRSLMEAIFILCARGLPCLLWVENYWRFTRLRRLAAVDVTSLCCTLYDGVGKNVTAASLAEH